MDSGSPRARPGLFAPGLVWAAALLLGVLPPFWREATPDVSWPLYLAERILEGAEQGRDFFEVNPPLFLWLSIPAVLLQRWFGLVPWQGAVLLLLSAAAISFGLVRGLLRGLEPGPARRQWLLAGFTFAVLVLPRLDFAQREHLALTLTVPYVVLVAGRLAGLPVSGGLAVLIGGLGAMGFSLKPYFLVSWVLLEALLLARLGRTALRRPELLVLVAAGMAYAIAVLVFTPAYLPMALRFAPHYTRYLDNGLWGVLVLMPPWLLAVPAVWLAHRAAVRHDDPLRDSLGLAFAGFLVAAFIQRKGFGYHYLAAQGFALLLLVRTSQIGFGERSRRPSSWIARAAPVLALGVILVHLAGAFRDTRVLGSSSDRRFAGLEKAYIELVPRVAALAAGETLMVFSTNPAMGWPLTAAAGARWGSRYMSLWPLAALYWSELWSRPYRIVSPRPLEARTGFEKEFLDETLADLERSQPRLLIVLRPDSTVTGWGGAWRFDYLAYFGADPRIARILSEYQAVDSVGGYVLLLRRGEPGGQAVEPPGKR